MILVADDDRTIQVTLKLILERNGYEVSLVSSPKEAVSFLQNNTPELILMDMSYSAKVDTEEGIELLKESKTLHPDVPVILMTAWGSVSLAVRGMQAGAFDFITKPWDNSVLMEHIRTALELNAKDSSKSDSASLSSDLFFRCGIIGKSPALLSILKTIVRIAPTGASVLITGESGTGKELIAEAIHRGSRRASGPFVKVNLGGIATSLFESEMFGHRKGAFTDAIADRIGRFKAADGGTIFLDEIGELDLSCQVKLLRVLQEQTFEPLGETKPQKVDVRVVSATNADLREMVKEHTFREDLFYRINLINIHLPALRERREDIPLLVKYFISRQSKINGLPEPKVSSGAMEFLSKQPFPGNIRELKNLVERTLLISDSETLTADDFKGCCESMPLADSDQRGETLDGVEKNHILSALKDSGWNVSKAALRLGISRQALYRRMEKFGLDLETGRVNET